MDPDTDVCQTEQPQISYSVDFTAEQSSAMGSPILLDREGTFIHVHVYTCMNSFGHGKWSRAFFLLWRLANAQLAAIFKCELEVPQDG